MTVESYGQCLDAQEQVLNVSPSKHGDDKKWWSKGKILHDAIGIDIGHWLEAGVRQFGYASMSLRMLRGSEIRFVSVT